MVKSECRECRGTGYREWSPDALVLQGRTEASRRKLAEMAGDIDRACAQADELSSLRPDKEKSYRDQCDKFIKETGDKMLDLVGLNPFEG